MILRHRVRHVFERPGSCSRPSDWNQMSSEVEVRKEHRDMPLWRKLFPPTHPTLLCLRNYRALIDLLVMIKSANLSSTIHNLPSIQLPGVCSDLAFVAWRSSPRPGNDHRKHQAVTSTPTLLFTSNARILNGFSATLQMTHLGHLWARIRASLIRHSHYSKRCHRRSNCSTSLALDDIENRMC